MRAVDKFLSARDDQLVPGEALQLPSRSLPNVLHWQTSHLLLPSGGVTLASALGQEGSYYRAFYDFIRGASGGRAAFESWLVRIQRDKDSSVARDALAARAAMIRAARAFAVSYHEAREYLPHLRKWQSQAGVRQIRRDVMDNYLKLSDSPEPHQILGRLDDYGRVVVIEGLHRATINFASGFAETPVAVVERSRRWIDLIEFFETQGTDLYGRPNALYHGIRHPDFFGFEVLREDRLPPIMDFVESSNFVRGLDLGSMIGEYSHRLAEAGVQMCAFEYEEAYADAMARLNGTYGVDVEIRRQNVLDLLDPAVRPPADFVLVLSLLYHLLRRDEDLAMRWVLALKETYDCIIVDSEPRTGILPASRLFGMFSDFDRTLLYSGADDRQIYAFMRDSAEAT